MTKKNKGTFVKDVLGDAIPWYVSRRLPPVQLREKWPELVGPYLATRALPVCLEPDGALLLAVHGAALRQELNLSASEVVKKLDQAGFAVSSLKIITARPLAPARPSPPPPPPLDDKEKEQIAAMLAGVKSPMVQKAFARMLEAGLGALKARQ